MSEALTGNGQLNPSAVLAAAADQLSSDGHADLAAAVQRVAGYLRELAVAHTDIAQASDRVLERGEALLDAAATDVPSLPGQSSIGPNPQRLEQRPPGPTPHGADA